MRTWLARAGISLIALLVVASAGFYVWTRVATYPAFPQAVSLAEETTSKDGWYVFEPDGEPAAGLIFYPGGLVDPVAYAPLMQRLSAEGVLAIIVPMPLDLAVFGIARANNVIAAYPGVESWIIAGHSLGGAMAAEYVKKNPDAVGGMVLLAAYPADSTDLSELSLPVVSLYGSEDGVAGDVFKDSMNRLPDSARLVEIEGGNHAQFGAYGPQKGDGSATIGRDAQQQQTAQAVLELVGRLQ